jgi:hypothetical protein
MHGKGSRNSVKWFRLNELWEDNTLSEGLEAGIYGASFGAYARRTWIFLRAA